MTRKDIADLVLAKVPEEKKEAFIAEYREAENKEARMAVVKKYGATLSKEQIEAIKKSGTNELSDEELDNASGGCNCMCTNCHGCYCGCG